jgi:murein DD-endopeptidase MepM/ murein hydrolase activator NlpD
MTVQRLNARVSRSTPGTCSVPCKRERTGTIQSQLIAGLSLELHATEVARGYLMKFVPISREDGFVSRIRQFFRPRELFIHDGSAMRRIHVSTRTQIGAASAAFSVFAVGALGVMQMVVAMPAVSGALTHFADSRAEVSAMEAKLASLQNDLVAVKAEAKNHAARLEARQAFLAAVMKGEQNPGKLAALLPGEDGKVSPAAVDVAAFFHRVDAQQSVLASAVQGAAETRYRSAVAMVARLGLSPDRLGGAAMTGMGGPYEPVSADAVAPAQVGQADPQFRALFNSWKRLDQLQTGIVAIPSMKPVDTLVFTSNFGIRTDPFRGGRAMHAGVDIPGAYATPIYATADAIVGRTGWAGGYGNLVELEHGKGIQTRYGHLSSILVTPGMRVKRGQMIALMGSTGRSTGTHLHYEVRIDGQAINPVPFLQTPTDLVAFQRRVGVAVGGPAEPLK